MARPVDRPARRRAVGDALLDLIGQHGMAGVSVRSVAAAAGCSVGAVQKYFTSKDEMLLYAVDLAGERTLQRIRQVDPAGPPRDTVRQWLLATAPLDADSRAQARVWLEFTTRAVTVPAFATAVADTDRELGEALADHLVHSCALDPRVARSTADALIAVVDGLSLRLLATASAAPPPADLPRDARGDPRARADRPLGAPAAEAWTTDPSRDGDPAVDLVAVLDRVLDALLPADPPTVSRSGGH